MSRVKSSLRFLANLMLFIKRIIIFFGLVLIALSIYKTLLGDILKNDNAAISLLLLWLLTAYVTLPRIHRRLTKIYLPNYFIGRVRTGDGLLGDPVNIAVTGTKQALIHTLKQAGWTQAEPLQNKSALRMISASIFNKSYPSAPVSSLFLFGNKQELAFQIEVNNNPHARHHVRFWKTPTSWYLPGGTKVDWLGAATYDRRIGFSLFTGQITHKISEDTDEERDFVATTIERTNEKIKSVVVPHFMSAYRDRNGGGDSIETDGGLLMINCR